MHRPTADHTFASQSLIHRQPPAIKVGVAMLLIISMVVVPREWSQSSITILATIGVALITAVALVRLSPAAFLRRLLLLEPFVLGIAIMSLFQPGGWRIMLLVVIKCTLCLATTIVLAATTPPSEMIRLLRHLHLPPLLVTTLMLMYRYLFILSEESQRMRRARASRTFTRHRWTQWKTLASVAGHLFIRASDRAERVYAAMCARGWQ